MTNDERAVGPGRGGHTALPAPGSRSAASPRSWASCGRSPATGSVPVGADEAAALNLLADLAPLQSRAFELIGISPAAL